MRLDTQWHGLERLTYFVLFPMLLIQTLVKADLSRCRSPASAARCCCRRWRCRCSASRCALPLARLDIDGPAFTSIFQGATRWQTYVALSVVRQHVRRCRAGAGLRGDGRDHSAGQRVQRRGARALRFAREAVRPRHRHDGDPQSPDLGLRRSASSSTSSICRCRRSGTRLPTRSAAPRSPSACSSPARACSSRACSVPSVERDASAWRSSWR